MVWEQDDKTMNLVCPFNESLVSVAITSWKQTPSTLLSREAVRKRVAVEKNMTRWLLK